MLWLDVCGPPGAGKSTLCDPLWGPHDVRIDDYLPPASWHDFLNEVTRLFHLIRKHWSFQPALRMNNRSIRKMATVARASGDGVYIQTGLVQRGLGFGWRLADMGADLNELRHFFRLMPVSVGVAVARCPESVVVERNHERTNHKETAHENRDFMVPLMLPAIEIAIEVLRDRGVSVAEIDTTQPIEQARKQLVDFSRTAPFYAEALGPGDKGEILSPPPWWIGPACRRRVSLDDRAEIRASHESADGDGSVEDEHVRLRASSR